MLLNNPGDSCSMSCWWDHPGTGSRAWQEEKLRGAQREGLGESGRVLGDSHRPRHGHFHELRPHCSPGSRECSHSIDTKPRL